MDLKTRKGHLKTIIFYNLNGIITTAHHRTCKLNCLHRHSCLDRYLKRYNQNRHSKYSNLHDRVLKSLKNCTFSSFIRLHRRTFSSNIHERVSKSLKNLLYQFIYGTPLKSLKFTLQTLKFSLDK